MENSKNKIRLFGTLQIMTISAALVAVSIVCGKYLAINLSSVIRFSFENLPIILAGIMFGPVIGAIVGGIADLIGALLVYGGDINIIITLGAISIGFFSGVLWKYFAKLPSSIRLLLAVLIPHIIGSVIIKSFGLAAYYFATQEMPVYILILWRSLNYLIVGSAEYFILFFIIKNKAVRSKMLQNQHDREKL